MITLSNPAAPEPITTFAVFGQQHHQHQQQQQQQ